MLVLIERGMAGSAGADRVRRYRRRRQASWLKVSLAGLAGVGVLGLGGLAVAAGVQQREPQKTNPPAVTPTENAIGATPTPRTSAGKPPAPAPKTHTSPPTSPATSASPSRNPAAPVVDGPIAAWGTVGAHSIIYWQQSDLTLDLAQPLTALTVELRVAQTGGVQSTGDWRTEPADNFTVSVAQTDGFVVYRWVLKPGLTVPATKQVFAAQFNHDAGKRDVSKDTFHVQATAGGRTAEVRGGFQS
jgi:cytoskeletal protein RodZ